MTVMSIWFWIETTGRLCTRSSTEIYIYISNLLGTECSNHDIEINIHELHPDTPAMVLMCAEPFSRMTHWYSRNIGKNWKVLSPRVDYWRWWSTLEVRGCQVEGLPPIQRGLRVLRRCMHWRIAMESAEQKKWSSHGAWDQHESILIYWKLWEVFSKCLVKVINMDAMAMLELPRGCD